MLIKGINDHAPVWGDSDDWNYFLFLAPIQVQHLCCVSFFLREKSGDFAMVLILIQIQPFSGSIFCMSVPTSQRSTFPLSIKLEIGCLVAAGSVC